ncbi:TPA_asm: hypothetical protein vir215_00031 [Ventrumvirus gergoviense]|uniref:Uncharacterized protein n=1 Tax=Caudoviricetes sp. vir215 TaxID=3068354 RepID=A0AA87CDL4_9CAUD|nr:TPA_asm: hypothetical protein vir215_00031 [Caudoviricetes sp. vir215]
MTDLDVIKRNPISGASIRMHIRHLERFSVEEQTLFAQLEKALDYPRQADLTQWEDDE